MKTRFYTSFAALSVLLFLIPFASKAQTVTTLLANQSFTGAAFPPSGWSSSGSSAFNPSTAPANASWYPSAGGNGGVGGTYGSAVAWEGGAYNMNAYGSSYNGYFNGALTLTTPAITTTSTDSQYVDFDLWYPYGEYMTSYLGMATNVQVLANTSKTVCLYLSGGSESIGNCTWIPASNTFPVGEDPASYPSSSYWRHYHVALPYGVTSQTITFQVAHGGIDSNVYTYWYTDNVAFTNIVVTNVHYPTLTVVPTSINFGSVPLGQSAGPYYSVVSNPNAVPISLSNYVFGGANPSDFTLFRAPVTIPPGGKDSVGIIYTPQASGSQTATLTFSSNGALPPTVTLNLSGTGVLPVVSYSSNAMFRGVNTELTDTSGVQYLYVNSTGLVPLKITRVTFFGLNANNYFVSHLPGSIPVGGVDSIGVRFVPSVEGQPDAHMVVTSNAGNIPSDTVGLFGVGILPHLTIDNGVTYPLPTTINFDSVKLGTDTCIQITLTNPGSDTIAIEKNYFQSADYDFSITPITGRDTLIAPGGSQQIQVCFTPLQQGHREAEIRIITDIPHTETTPPQDTSSFIVNIIGIGVPTGKLMLTGSTKKDSAFIGKTVTVTDTFWNTGDAALTVTTVNISGTKRWRFYRPLPNASVHDSIEFESALYRLGHAERPGRGNSLADRDRHKQRDSGKYNVSPWGLW